MFELFIGIIVSLIISECTGFSAGGIVVAGYLALFYKYPLWILSTVVVALLVRQLIVFLGKYTALYGRRLFAICLLSGIALSQLLNYLSSGGRFIDGAFVVIGYLVPGLLARDFLRQGIVSTLLVCALAVSIIIILNGLWEGSVA